MSSQSIRLTSVDIDNALEKDHLDVVFQPIVDLADRKILRHEVFVRWQHPGLGALPPGAFINFFEAQGRISDLTRYVIRRAVKLRPSEEADIGLSLNLSIADLTDDALVTTIQDALDDADMPTSALVLECPAPPGGMAMTEQEKLYERAASIGCPLSLEIRGRSIPEILTAKKPLFTEIKTSGSHILRYARMSRSGPGLTAIADLIEFAKGHDLFTVAVGVEEIAGADALAAIGFDAGQGKALGRVQSQTEEDEAPKAVATPLPHPTTDDKANTAAKKAAAKKLAALRLKKANAARSLQSKLQKSFTAPETVPTPDPLPETKPAKALAPNPLSDGVAQLVSELPTEIDSRSAAPNFSIDVTAEEPSEDLPASEEVLSEPPAADEQTVTFVVHTEKKTPIMPKWLRKKYRITHFWPRSWKRAWRARQKNQENDRTLSDAVSETS